MPVVSQATRCFQVDFSMSEATPQLDAAVRAAYDEQPHAVDRILTNPEHRQRFLRSVARLCEEARERQVLEHLERLRKKGAAKGGLPRKAR